MYRQTSYSGSVLNSIQDQQVKVANLLDDNIITSYFDPNILQDTEVRLDVAKQHIPSIIRVQACTDEVISKNDIELSPYLLVDGTTVPHGSCIMLINQPDTSRNGIYIVGGNGNPLRENRFLVFILAGMTYRNCLFIRYNDTHFLCVGRSDGSSNPT